MANLYSTWPDKMNEDVKRSMHRLLKRLRIALFIWLVCFLGTVIWFTYCP